MKSEISRGERSPIGGALLRVSKTTALTILIATATLLQSCAMSTTPTPVSSAAATVPLGPASGTWQGTSTSRANEVRKITLRLLQNGENVTGDYYCDAGNSACRNLNDSGTIRGKITGEFLAVAITMSPDNSQCYFKGTLVESLAYGDYTCMDRGKILEIGAWKIKRLG